MGSIVNTAVTSSLQRKAPLTSRNIPPPTPSQVLLTSLVPGSGETSASTTSRALTSSIRITGPTRSVERPPIATMPDKPESTPGGPSKITSKSSSLTSSTNIPFNSHNSTHVTSTRDRPQTSSKPPLEHISNNVISKTSTSVSVKEGPRSTRTSTITDLPVSTFSSAVPVTVTSDGKLALSVPPLVTLLSTSTQPGGDFVTYTHVVANPTNFSVGSPGINSSGFLSNHGAVAGVFVVVGVVVATTAMCLALLFRRRRRRRRRTRWLEGMRQQGFTRQSDPFDDSNGPPQMRSTHSEPIAWDGMGSVGSHQARPLSIQSAVSQQHSAMGLVDPNAINIHRAYNNLWRGNEHQVNAGPETNVMPSTVSVAQSSPSIYPPSLPPVDDDDRLDPVFTYSAPSQNPFVPEPPPRPPRSVLRRNSVKLSEIYPLTPPASASSHSHSQSSSKPPSPIVEQPHFKGPQDILTRRTLLDVRPRPPDLGGATAARRLSRDFEVL